MNKFKAYIIFILFLPYVSISQIFSISEIHSEEFPLIKASFSILNEDGDYYKNISASDFRIFDYFKNVSASIKVNCIEKKVEPPVSIVLVLDMSQSMIIPTNNEIRWDWVIEGAKSFINALNFIDSTKVAIIGFNDNVSLLCDFTNNKSKLIESIENISPNGGTLYDSPFLDKTYGAIELLKSQPRDMKRVAIFLTDGNPNVNPNTQHIIFQLQKSNIQVFSITLLVKMNDYLRKISEESGGKSYEIWNKYQLMSLYELIAFYVQTLQFCEISWEAPYGCSSESTDRFSSITFIPTQQTRLAYYTAPERSVPFIKYSLNKIYFGNPQPLDTVKKNLKITAKYKSFIIDSIKVYPDDSFKITQPKTEQFPILLNEDSSRTIDVEFIQGPIRHFQDGKLIIYSKPCDSYINLYAGNPTIEIINPLAGQIFSSCDSILIRWEGIEKSKPVNLYYSINKDNNWNIIDTNIMGSAYQWQLPQDIRTNDSNKIFIKAIAPKESKYLWSHSFGGIGDEYVNSIILSKDKSDLYIAGNFQDTIVIDKFNVGSRNSQDLFVISLNTKGEINWAKSFGSPKNDSLASIISDDEGELYLTGYCNNNYDDNNEIRNDLIENKKYCFLTKLDKNGSTIKTIFFGATKNYQNFETIGEQLTFSNQEIIIRGKYKGRIRINNVLYMSDNKYQDFEAVFLKNLDFISFREIEKALIKHKLSVSDIDDIHYTVENFSDSITINDKKFISSGLRDFIVYKNIIFSEIYDIIDSSIIITRPYYFKITDSLNMGEIAIGSEIKNKNFPVLINNSPFVLNIQDVKINNNNALFAINDKYQKILFPTDTLKLELSFSAKSIGDYSSDLIVNFNCAKSSSFTLKGIGICDSRAIDTIDFHNVEINYEKDSIIQSAFYNLNSIPISINPIIKGINSIDFRLSELINKIIQPNDSVEIRIYFTPTYQDERLAYIDWQVQSGCENKITYLKGKGLKAKLSVSSIDWGKRRKLSINDSLTYLINENNFPITLDTFYFEESNKIFINHLKEFPYVIMQNDSLAIPISFQPEDTLEYRNSLVIVVDSLERPLYVPLKGIGILPVIKTEWICGKEIKPGQTSQAQLIIKNISSNSSLKIYDCKLIDSSEFNWLDESKKKDILIPETDSIVIKLLFTPKTIGERQNIIQIFSDAKSGNEINPIDTTTQIIHCESRGIVFSQKLDFNNNILCNSDTFRLVLANAGGSTPLIINSYKFEEKCTDCDSSAFYVLLDSILTINPKDSGFVKIVFQPTKEKNYKTKMKLFTNQNDTIPIELTGIGRAIRLYSEISNYSIPVGADTNITINVNIPNAKGNEINEIYLQIKYDNRNQRFDLNSIYSYIPNLDWVLNKYLSNGEIMLKGEGVLPYSYSGKFIKLNYSTYLGDSLNINDIFSLYNADCQLSKPLDIKIILDGVCAGDLRRVRFSNDKFQIFEPHPNPANNETSLVFILPFKIQGKIDLFNEIGNKVLNIADKVFPSGKNQIKISLEDMPSGIYSISYNFGNNYMVKRFIIIK